MQNNEDKEKEIVILKIYKEVEKIIRLKGTLSYNLAQKIHRKYNMDYDDIRQEIIVTIIKRFPRDKIRNIFSYTMASSNNIMKDICKYNECNKWSPDFTGVFKSKNIEFNKKIE